jgi:hypothetical protein
MARRRVSQRLLVAVEPRLLSETLARALGADYEVLVADPATWRELDASDTHFDVAIVTNDRLPDGVSVDRLLVLPSPSPSPDVGVLRTPGGSRTVPVDGLAAIAAALDRGEASAVGE